LKGRPETFRADEPHPSLSQEDLASMAPEWESGHFVVPQVIESE
jgi:aspartyl/glutamyl-tRNA(Asn/Gln) amidotransferase C subunit